MTAHNFFVKLILLTIQMRMIRKALWKYNGKGYMYGKVEKWNCKINSADPVCGG